MKHILFLEPKVIFPHFTKLSLLILVDKLNLTKLNYDLPYHSKKCTAGNFEERPELQRGAARTPDVANREIHGPQIVHASM